MSHILKTLIAYDDSPTARAMLSNLRAAGLGSAVEARVLTVSDPWIPPMEALSVSTDVLFSGAYAAANEQMEGMLEEAGNLSSKGAAQLRKDFPGWKITAASTMDAPAQGILHAADK